MDKKVQQDLYEFDILLKLIENRKNIFPKTNNDYNYYESLFNKGFSIEYLSDIIPEEITITKFKKRNDKLENLILDEENKSIGKITINGDKKLEKYFIKDKIRKKTIEFEKNNNNKSKNIIMPKIYFSFNCISEISKYIHTQELESNLILKNTYFKMNSNNLEMNFNMRYELLLEKFNDPKGDLWYIFMIKDIDSKLENNVLKGYKQYTIKK